MMMTLNTYFEYYRDYICQIDLALEQYILRIDDWKLRTQMSWATGIGNSSSTRSKRLRGVLLLALDNALNNNRASQATALAAAIEIVHCASLVVDDIQDGHLQRWSEPSLWVRIGQPMAINVSLILGTLAMRITQEVMPSCALLLHNTMIRMAIGQTSDLQAQELHDEELVGYSQIASAKTGALLECAARMACENADEALLVNKIVVFASALGIAHQIRDDLDDICSQGNRSKLSPSNIWWFLSPKNGVSASDKSRLLQAEELVIGFAHQADAAIRASNIPAQGYDHLQPFLKAVTRLARNNVRDKSA